MDTDLERTRQRAGASPEDALLGKVGPYRLVEFLGKGGVGLVYRAVDADHAEVAVKVMTSGPLMPQAEIRRFLREAETCKRLRSHPNIITVYDTGQDGHNHYIVMELVPGGRTLDDRMAGKALPDAEALAYAVPVAQALAYAHGQGILHRDLKPANILVNEFDQPLLADFGLAKPMAAPNLTITGTLLGTPRYMAPEQCGGEDGETTNQSDIYAFGVMLYEMLTGQSPYPITAEMGLPELFAVIREHNPIPPRRLRPEIGRNLEAVVLRLIDKEKRLRYKDMAQVCADLEACRDGRPVSVRRLSPAERWEKWLRRHAPTAVAVAAVVALALGIYFGVLLPRSRKAAYAKQQADVRAVAARQRAIRLEAELAALRHPGMPQGDQDSVGAGHLRRGRDLLAAGRLADARPAYQAAAEWAAQADHQGLLREARTSLARIAMARGENAQAAAILAELAAAHGPGTLAGQLALFEAGAAHWRQGNEPEALQRWQEILRASRADARRGIDIAGPVGYLGMLSEAMLEPEAAIDEARILAASPDVLKGLGHWILAQRSARRDERARHLAAAIRHREIFCWINQEAEDDDDHDHGEALDP